MRRSKHAAPVLRTIKTQRKVDASALAELLYDIFQQNHESDTLTNRQGDTNLDDKNS